MTSPETTTAAMRSAGPAVRTMGEATETPAWLLAAVGTIEAFEAPLGVSTAQW